MNRFALVSVVVLSGCLDSLTLLPAPEPVVEPRREERPSVAPDASVALSDVDAGFFTFDAGFFDDPDAGVEIEQPVMVVDAGAAPMDAGSAADAGCSCPSVANAQSMCSLGVCTRGPCEPGFFDVDPAVPGCESTCTGATCTGPSGVITLTSPPVPERAHGVFSTTGIRTDSSRGDLGMGGALATPHRPFLH
jgi:hypothetical protein